MLKKRASETFTKAFLRKDIYFTRAYRFKTELRFSKLYRVFNPLSPKAVSFDRKRREIRFEFRKDFESDQRSKLRRMPVRLWREIEAFSDFLLGRGEDRGLEDFRKLASQFYLKRAAIFSVEPRRIYKRICREILRKTRFKKAVVGNYDGLIANAKVQAGKVILIDFEWYCLCPKEYLLARLTIETGTFFADSKSNRFDLDLYYLLTLAFLFENFEKFRPIQKRLRAYFSR